MNAKRGDVVLVDLGYAAKIRPYVVLSVPKADTRRKMTVVVPLTTEIRGGETEVPFPKPHFLTHVSVANLIGIAGVDDAKFGRVLGLFPPAQFPDIEEGVARMLGL
jgi:mRNA interferase MazF